MTLTTPGSSSALAQRIVHAADEPVVNLQELRDVVSATLRARVINQRCSHEECAAMLATAIITRRLFSWGSVRNSIRAVNEYMKFVGRRPFLDGTQADEQRIKYLYYPHDDVRIGELSVDELAHYYTSFMASHSLA